MIDFSAIDFKKGNGLVTAVVQEHQTGKVLMTAFMNREALEKTLLEGKVTFMSRSKGRLWTKGEQSGNFLHLVEMKHDCDGDALLLKVRPEGPVCHTGADTCFGEVNQPDDELTILERTISERLSSGDDESYTRKLVDSGINKVAQKVGEEAVELVIEAKDNDRDKFLGESADLMYHFLVLLRAKGHSLDDVREVLRSRRKS